jgi:DNA-directed RNA polymerase subunit RPC12/RpoP
MLRTKCIWCGKTVRGGDDWAGRSGKCPNCGAEIIFPQIGPLPTEPAPATPYVFIDPKNYWLAEDWGAAGVVALCGVAAWIWMQLIVLLAFGFHAYKLGLRLTMAGRVPGVTLNSGQCLSFFWATLFVWGFITTWAFLIRSANYFVWQSRPRSRAIALVLLLGLWAWISLFAQAMAAQYRFAFRFPESPVGQAIVYFVAICSAAGIVLWRDFKGEGHKDEIEMSSSDADAG